MMIICLYEPILIDKFIGHIWIWGLVHFAFLHPVLIMLYNWKLTLKCHIEIRNDQAKSKAMLSKPHLSTNLGTRKYNTGEVA